jgi:hypothetical protein
MFLVRVFLNAGPGRTVIVKLESAPRQLSELALIDTVMVAVMGLPVALVALNGGILPWPLCGKPMSAPLLFHEKEVFGDELENGIPSRKKAPLQTVVSLSRLIRGVGFTVTRTESSVSQSAPPVERVKI